MGGSWLCLWLCSTASGVLYDTWISGDDVSSAVSVSRSEAVGIGDLDDAGEQTGARVRDAPGGTAAAEALWEGWKRDPNVDVEPLPDGKGWKGTDTKTGDVVTYRPKSGKDLSGPPTIDYKRAGSSGNKKLKFG